MTLLSDKHNTIKDIDRVNYTNRSCRFFSRKENLLYCFFVFFVCAAICSGDPIRIDSGKIAGVRVTMFSGYERYKTVEEYESARRKLYKDSAELILDVYGVKSNEDIKNAVNQHINDSWFAQPTRWMARHMSKVNQNTYLYHFAHQSINWPAGGSSHAAELTTGNTILSFDRLK